MVFPARWRVGFTTILFCAGVTFRGNESVSRLVREQFSAPSFHVLPSPQNATTSTSRKLGSTPNATTTKTTTTATAKDGSNSTVQEQLSWIRRDNATDDASAGPPSSSRRRRPRAIVHLGPKKTGTTSIQTWFREHAETLAEVEGWHWVPIIAHPFRFVHRNEEAVEKTFQMANLSSNLIWHAQQEHDIVVSHEFLAIIPQESTLMWNRFKELLAPFDVSLVFTYRRLYDWLLSNHADDSKTRSRNFPLSPDFGQLLDSKIRAGKNPQPKMALTAHDPFRGTHGAVHPVQAITQLYQRQGFYNITIINMHNTSDIVPTFVCQTLGPSSPSCQNLTAPPPPSREGKKDPPQKSRKNVRSDQWQYNRLARAMMARYASLTFNSMLHTAWTIFLAETLKRHQERDLKLTMGDFPQTCPDPAQMDRLLNASLESERALFPEFFETPQGREGLLQHFQKLKSKGAFCNIDVHAVAQDPSWSAYVTEILAALEKDRDRLIRKLSITRHVPIERVTRKERST